MINEDTVSSLAPVANIPAWNLLIMPGPLMGALASETPIPTFELSAPGPYIPRIGNGNRHRLGKPQETQLNMYKDKV